MLGRRRPRTIQSALVGLVVACIVPAWAATTLLIIHSYQRERASVEEDTVETARALTQAVDGRLRGAQSALQVLAKSPYLASGDLARFYAQATDALPDLAGNNVVLIAPDGTQVMNTLSPFGAKPPSDKEEPQLLRAFETGRPVISDLFSGRLTKQNVVAVEVPVIADGAIVYLLAMGIFPERLARVLRQQQLPATWVAAIFDSNGTIVARTQRAEEYVGRHGSPDLIRRIAETGEGVIESETLEGIPVVSSFSRSAVSGWSVAIGIPTAEAFGPLRRSLWLSIAGASVLLLLCLSLAQAISRQIASAIEVLAERAAALGANEAIAIPPLRIREADEAAKAMVQASSALRQRTAEREASERAEHRLLVEKRAAEEASQAKSDFLALMSHEIRTPMTSVIGMTELLLGSNLTARQRHHATLLKDAGELLLAIINDLLDMSKIEAGKLELERVPLNLSEIAQGAVAIVQPQATAKKIDLRCELSPDLPTWIEGDPTRLRQILLNLLSNALKFTQRGSIALKVMREPAVTRIRFEVMDTGIGIAAEEQELLFQRFSRVGPRVGDAPGTGLGLAISRQLVQAMGGGIGLTSRVGRGSTFWFTIPYEERRMPANTEARVAETGGISRRRILLAEDNYMIQELIETFLTEAGHEVFLAQNGAEAIEALERNDFDMVLMDISMPDIDGITATRRIRQMGERIRDIPIIALTAYAMTEDVEMFQEAGVDDHLAKPVKRDELLRKVAAWSGRGDSAKATAAIGAPALAVDAAVLATLEQQIGASRVTSLAQRFRAELEKATGDIGASSDRAAIERQAHAIVSLAGTLGCAELAACSRSLMEAARTGSGELAPLVAAMAAAAARASAALRQRYPELAEKA